MTDPSLTFHHHGLAVPSPDEAFLFLEGLGYELGEPVFDPLQGVNLALCAHATLPTVEVVWPGEGPSPIDRVLKGGSTLYHTCYATSDANAWLAATEARGVSLVTVSPPTPAVLFGGLKVSFHLVSGFGLVELLHIDGANFEERAGTAD